MIKFTKILKIVNHLDVFILNLLFYLLTLNIFRFRVKLRVYEFYNYVSFFLLTFFREAILV